MVHAGQCVSKRNSFNLMGRGQGVINTFVTVQLCQSEIVMSINIYSRPGSLTPQYLFFLICTVCKLALDYVLNWSNPKASLSALQP